MRALAGIAAAIVLASAAAAQTPAPTPAVSPKTKPKAAGTPATPKTSAPVDFTGDWVLDPKASKGVSEAMEAAVLRVRQTGNHIWIEPVGGKGRRLLSDEIVADGRTYDKVLGARQKGTVQAAWGKDGELWIEAVVGTEENPSTGRQRMIWRLRDGGQTWTRQTRTLQEDGSSHDTFLVFRKKPLGSFVPTPRPTPADGAPK